MIRLNRAVDTEAKKLYLRKIGKHEIFTYE